MGAVVLLIGIAVALELMLRRSNNNEGEYHYPSTFDHLLIQFYTGFPAGSLINKFGATQFVKVGANVCDCKFEILH